MLQYKPHTSIWLSCCIVPYNYNWTAVSMFLMAKLYSGNSFAFLLLDKDWAVNFLKIYKNFVYWMLQIMKIMVQKCIKWTSLIDKNESYFGLEKNLPDIDMKQSAKMSRPVGFVGAAKTWGVRWWFARMNIQQWYFNLRQRWSAQGKNEKLLLNVLYLLKLMIIRVWAGQTCTPTQAYCAPKCT